MTHRRRSRPRRRPHQPDRCLAARRVPRAHPAGVRRVSLFRTPPAKLIGISRPSSTGPNLRSRSTAGTCGRSCECRSNDSGRTFRSAARKRAGRFARSRSRHVRCRALRPHAGSRSPAESADDPSARAAADQSNGRGRLVQALSDARASQLKPARGSRRAGPARRGVERRRACRPTARSSRRRHADGADPGQSSARHARAEVLLRQQPRRTVRCLMSGPIQPAPSRPTRS